MYITKYIPSIAVRNIAEDCCCAKFAHLWACVFTTSAGTRRRHRRLTRLPDDCVRRILESLVPPALGVPPDVLWAHSRGAIDVAFARQVAMYLAHVAFELSFTAVGRVFERDRTTVAYACSVVEDRRDDAVFDRSLDLLESAARLLARRRQPARRAPIPSDLTASL